ncbi:M50 family metallopeptidase [Paenibacillus sp. J2TS4]|uniref:M50 family metallopeptidase n=1 Tax=Paenibacillus sp. J2TS4 TaxID=2807194 RepID=UPI001B20A58E|nr:M50 family metallopeptidase [Paenibacillus sp. J2TS4]GIP31370.1 stage IV sporulation protein FB [Paenibacillus sp. J2TS4]
MNKWLGTRYRLHPLFVVMMLLSLITGYFLELLTLFGIVFIHELGHVFTAKSFGWNVTEVRLLPFGGVAVVEESGNVPAREELIVALAGPLQNVWMALFALFIMAMGGSDPEWWVYFMKANLLVGAFNLLPILPLDGGKIMQASLSYLLPYHRTLFITTVISLIMSVGLVVIAMLPWSGGGIQLNLLVIGLFLLYSNWYGYRHLPFQYIRFLMSRHDRFAAHWMRGAIAQPIIVSGSHRVPEIIRLFMREQYHLIYIMSERGVIRHVVPEQRLIDLYFSEKKRNYAISDLFV